MTATPLGLKKEISDEWGAELDMRNLLVIDVPPIVSQK